MQIYTLSTRAIRNQKRDDGQLGSTPIVGALATQEKIDNTNEELDMTNLLL